MSNDNIKLFVTFRLKLYQRDLQNITILCIYIYIIYKKQHPKFLVNINKVSYL